jgi:NAD(P)-dependent dehydrogenase (short-subunit alcohol dehydrogenase family)
MTIRGGGRLIHVSSRVAVAGAEVAAVYGAAKGGVVGLVRSLALVGKSVGVTVDVISPAPMDTPMRWAATPSFDRARTLPPEAIADLIVTMARHPTMRFEDGAVPLALRY